MEIFLNVFTEFSEVNDKNICHQEFEPATTCVRDQDATTVPARHFERQNL